LSAKVFFVEISSIEVNEHGFVDVNDTIEAIRENTILISVMLANNETGVIQVIIDLISIHKIKRRKAQYIIH